MLLWFPYHIMALQASKTIRLTAEEISDATDLLVSTGAM